MAKTIKEERLKWVLPIIQKELKLIEVAKVFSYGHRTLERWVARYKQYGESGLEPHSTARKTQQKETPIRKCAFKIKTSSMNKKCINHLKTCVTGTDYGICVTMIWNTAD